MLLRKEIFIGVNFMINEELLDIFIDYFNYLRNIGIIDYLNG